MTHPMTPCDRPFPTSELCVVILAPFGQDAALMAQMLASADMQAQCVSDMEAFARKLPGCAVGLLTTEALSPEGIEHLQAALLTQPPWSDIPLILLTTRIDAASYRLLASTLGNVTILQRPLEAGSLLTVVSAALRARRKQYEIRDLLIATQMRQEEIEALNVRLQRAMQETHHRVKNNLQVIAALVEMEENNVEGAANLRRIKQHAQALALIHDILTAQAKGDASDTSFVSAQMVLQKLIPMLDRSSGGRRVWGKVENMLLPVQKSAALALLVNECVSNAMKHGEGDVEITLRLSDDRRPDRERQAARWAHLEVCDDGPGFPPGFDPRQSANTGLELIDSAARWDLRGEVAYENRKEGGARIVVTFPIAGSSE